MTAKGPGEAVGNAHDTTRCDVGMCLRYVRTWWEVGSLYGSAIEAWNGARYKHPGDRNPPKGAPLFYRGGNYGHIVIADPGHQGMRSTDCRSSAVVSDAEISWVEVTWGYTYLGWTRDLNGVTLPLEDEDEMTESDWDRLEDLVRRVVWQEHMAVTQPNGSDTNKAREQVLRETYQTVKRS